MGTVKQTGSLSRSFDDGFIPLPDDDGFIPLPGDEVPVPEDCPTLFPRSVFSDPYANKRTGGLSPKKGVRFSPSSTKRSFEEDGSFRDQVVPTAVLDQSIAA